MSRVHVWTYPWDVAAWGIERTADMLAGLGVDGVSLAVSYHAGQILSLAGDTPRLIFPPAGVPLWRCPPEGLPGPLAGVAWQGWLERLSAALTARDIALRAWAVTQHDAEGRPVVNAFGQAVPHALCPLANADRLDTLARELRAQGVFAAAEMEATGGVPAFHGGHHDIAGAALTPLWQVALGTCTCGACRAGAQADGVDVDDAVRTLSDLAVRLSQREAPPVDPLAELDAALAAAPSLGAYLASRARRARGAVDAAQAAFGGRLAIVGVGHASVARWPALAGMDAAPPAAGVDEEIVPLAYGAIDASVADVRRLLDRGWTAERLVAGITLIEAATPDLDAALSRLGALRGAGVRRISLYNLGILPPARRAWIARMADAMR